MPPELPGFYYDSEKNRYFPIKGPIPGSSRRANASSSTSATAKKPASKLEQVNNSREGRGAKAAKLLHSRELFGNVITSRKRKFNFEVEYQKAQASRPLVWKYHGTENLSHNALETVRTDLETPEGLVEAEMLLAGGINRSLDLFEVQQAGQESDHGIIHMPEQVWPGSLNNQERNIKIPSNLRYAAGVASHITSSVSCVKASQPYSSQSRHALITTLGSESSGGSVFMLNLNEPLDRSLRDHIPSRRIQKITSLNCTIWTADCSSDMKRVAVGTNVGAALVNIETGRSSWACCCKSDILSLQMVNSRNIILCGLRNGAIISVDSRENPERLSFRLTRHQIPYPTCNTVASSSQSSRCPTKRWFELKGCINLSSVISMPSSISCLTSLKLYDQYFLASSMDGLIKLYDHRLTQRGAIQTYEGNVNSHARTVGPVQSYEGNVNSHTRLQLGVDPSETMMMSGGEDCYLRLWSIKSGELLFKEKFMDSVPSVIKWPRTLCSSETREHFWGAWLGSYDGIFFAHGPD